MNIQRRLLVQKEQTFELPFLVHVGATFYFHRSGHSTIIPDIENQKKANSCLLLATALLLDTDDVGFCQIST